MTSPVHKTQDLQHLGIKCRLRKVELPSIEWLQTGDSRAWDAAFPSLWPLAWSAANRRLSHFSPGIVEDIAIEAIREAAEQVDQRRVESYEMLRRLTVVIANRRALDHIRRMSALQRAAQATEPLEGHEDLPTNTPGPFDRLDSVDLARFLTDLADNLPPNQRLLLKGFYLEGLRQAELAEKYSMPIGTIGATLSRALEAIQKELLKHPELMQELKERLR